jgi:hypothetical protein
MSKVLFAVKISPFHPAEMWKRPLVKNFDGEMQLCKGINVIYLG